MATTPPINYAQALADYVAQQKAAYQAPELTWRQMENGGYTPPPDDWTYAQQWDDQQADPVVRGALQTLLSQHEQMRQSENSTIDTFDPNRLGDEINNAWRERVYGKLDDGWDTATASDAIKNAIKLKGQLVGLNDPYVKQGAFSMDNKAGGADQHYGSLALQLADRGISDISQLSWGGDKGDKLYFNGQDIGALNDARGHGWTDYDYVKGPDGKPVFIPRWGDSSDNKKIATGLAIASMFVPGLNVAVGSMLGASGGLAAALGGGIINGAISAIGGGNFGKGFLTGAIAPVGGMDAAGAMGVTDKLASGVINGAVKGGLSSAINGGNVGKGILTGAASGGLQGFNPAGVLDIDNKALAGAVNGAVNSGLNAAIRGGNAGAAALSGAISGGINGLNPGEILSKDKAVQGVVNGLVAGALKGQNGKQLLNQALPGMLKAGGSLIGSALNNSTTASYSNEGRNYSGPNGLDPVGNSPVYASGDSGDNYSHEGRNYSGIKALSAVGNSPAYTGDDTPFIDLSGYQDYSNEGRNYSGLYGLNPVGNSPVYSSDENYGNEGRAYFNPAVFSPVGNSPAYSWGDSDENYSHEGRGYVDPDDDSRYVAPPNLPELIDIGPPLDNARIDEILNRELPDIGDPPGEMTGGVNTDPNWMQAILNGLGGLVSTGSKSGGIGGSLASLIGAGVGAAQSGKPQTTTIENQIDPRMAQYLYGTGVGDPNSLLGAAQQLWQQNRTGLNPAMQQGLDMQRATLQDPAYAQPYQQMRSVGTGLLGANVAGNPFLSTNGSMSQAGGVGGLLGDNPQDRAKALIAAGRGLL